MGGLIKSYLIILEVCCFIFVYLSISTSYYVDISELLFFIWTQLKPVRLFLGFFFFYIWGTCSNIPIEDNYLVKQLSKVLCWQLPNMLIFLSVTFKKHTILHKTDHDGICCCLVTSCGDLWNWISRI